MKRPVGQYRRKKYPQPIKVAAVALALGAAVATQPSALQAANIIVDAGSGGLCTLENAIVSANIDVALPGGCTGGSGADTITLVTDVTLSAALPDIITDITIEGNGHIIDGGGSGVATWPVLRVLVSGTVGTLTLNNTIIQGGNNSGNGGGIFVDSGTGLTLNSSTVTGNESGGNGGGIFVGSSSIVLNNSTVSGNTATNSGGGIFAVSSAIVFLNNSTVTGNTASNSPGYAGGGISADSSAIVLNNSLISGNTAYDADEIWNNYTVTADNYNLIGHSGLTNTEAFFGFTPGPSDLTATSDGTRPTPLNGILNTTLGNNGGNLYNLTHALPAGSPAIDLDPDTCETGLAEDQRGTGYPRSSFAGCDGAYIRVGGAFAKLKT